MPSIDQLRRLLARWLCFVSFGLGGVFLSLCVFPPVRLLYPQRSAAINRRIVSRSFRLFVAMIDTLGVIRFDIEGAEILKADHGCLIVANHPTLIDYVVIASLIDHCDCVVKPSMWLNPFTRGVVNAVRYIPRHDAEDVIEQCHRSLSEGNVLLIFPEGTRTAAGMPVRLQRGAANIALRAGMPMRMVHIDCRPHTLNKEEKWYAVPPRRSEYKLRVGELINTAPFAENATSLAGAARHLTTHLHSQLTGGTYT
jgi:1-acyl-sn-glycerol-3-phosphate acyltransferase